MSIIVKGMEIPKNCIECVMQAGGFCFVMPPEIEDERVAKTPAEAVERGKPEWCPLVELPEKHGDLIDIKAFKESIESYSSVLPEERELIGKLIYNEPIILEREE